LKDIKARSLAKLVSSLDLNLQRSSKDRVWTPEEFAMVLRDAIASRSLSVNRNSDELLAEFEMIEEALEPLKKEIEKCKEDANVSSVRTAFTFTGIIFT
jgi:hypothetical protein